MASPLCRQPKDLMITQARAGEKCTGFAHGSQPDALGTQDSAYTIPDSAKSAPAAFRPTPGAGRVPGWQTSQNVPGYAPPSASTFWPVM